MATLVVGVMFVPMEVVAFTLVRESAGLKAVRWFSLVLSIYLNSIQQRACIMFRLILLEQHTTDRDRIPHITHFMYHSFWYLLGIYFIGGQWLHSQIVYQVSFVAHLEFILLGYTCIFYLMYIVTFNSLFFDLHTMRGTTGDGAHIRYRFRCLPYFLIVVLSPPSLLRIHFKNVCSMCANLWTNAGKHLTSNE